MRGGRICGREFGGLLVCVGEGVVWLVMWRVVVGVGGGVVWWCCEVD